MKKCFLLLIFLLSMAKIHALPLGNPSEASLFFRRSLCLEECAQCCDFFLDVIDLRIGFYGDYVFNRHLETVTDRKIDYTQMTTNAGYIALNFCETFDIFTTLGATKFSFNTSLGPFNSGNRSPRFDFESSTTFSWSIGARGSICEYNCFSWGVMGQYFSACPKPKVLFIRANVDDYPDETSRRKYSEWQLGTGISYRYNYYFIPYAAIKYSHVRWNFNNETFLVTGTAATIPTLKNTKNWGVAIGTSLAPFNCEKILVTVEGRFWDESAVYVNGQIHF